MRTAFLLTAFLASTIMAQTIDRTKPPKTPPLAPFHLPPLFETTLENGMHLVLVEDGRFPLIQVRMGFQAGSKFDPAPVAGLSEMAAELLKEGTVTRSSRQFAEELAEIGGSLDADANPDFLTVSGSALSDHLDKLLVLLADMVQKASFPEEEVRLRKQNRKQELAHQLTQPDVLADEKFREVIFGDHPYSRMLPTPESIDRVTREGLTGFREKFLAPNNAVLVLVGPVSERKTVVAMIEQRFAGWEKREMPGPPAAKFPEPKRSLSLLDRPGSVQADMRAGTIAVDRKHPDYFPLLVANTILGGGTSSRMFVRIREEKGYAYDAHSNLTPRLVSGLFVASTQVRNEVVEPALEALLSEMRLMATEPVAAAELEAAKNYMSGNFAIGLETPGALAGQLVSVKLNGMPNEYLEKYVARIRAVGPAEIQKVFARYMNQEKLTTVVVGDAGQIGAKLEKFGKAQVEKVTR